MTSQADGAFLKDGDAYARYRPTYPPDFVAALAGLAPNRRLAVDVGCGTGQLSRLLADHFDRVLAIDASASQIAHAEPRPNLQYAVGSAEALGPESLKPEKLGPKGTEPEWTGPALITAAQAAHWFDLEAFYGEVRRIAAADGILALILYGRMEIAGPLGERIRHFSDRELAGYWPDGRRHVLSAYADLPFPFHELEAPMNRITRAWPRDVLLGYLETWSAVRKARRAGHHSRIDAFMADATALCEDPSAPIAIVWPVRARVGRI